MEVEGWILGFIATWWLLVLKVLAGAASIIAGFYALNADSTNPAEKRKAATSVVLSGLLALGIPIGEKLDQAKADKEQSARLQTVLEEVGHSISPLSDLDLRYRIQLPYKVEEMKAFQDRLEKIAIERQVRVGIRDTPLSKDALEWLDRQREPDGHLRHFVLSYLDGDFTNANGWFVPPVFYFAARLSVDLRVFSEATSPRVKFPDSELVRLLGSGSSEAPEADLLIHFPEVYGDDQLTIAGKNPRVDLVIDFFRQEAFLEVSGLRIDRDALQRSSEVYSVLDLARKRLVLMVSDTLQYGEHYQAAKGDLAIRSISVRNREGDEFIFDSVLKNPQRSSGSDLLYAGYVLGLPETVPEIRKMLSSNSNAHRSNIQKWGATGGPP